MSKTGPVHKELFLYCDGGSRGNPGHSAAGWAAYPASAVAKDFSASGDALLAGHAYLGHGTNNQAEYQSVMRGLDAVKPFLSPASVLRVVMDSQLVIRQLAGVYRVKEPKLQVLWREAIAKINALKADGVTVHLHDVRREYNKNADAQVNECLDNRA